MKIFSLRSWKMIIVWSVILGFLINIAIFYFVNCAFAYSLIYVGPCEIGWPIPLSINSYDYFGCGNSLQCANYEIPNSPFATSFSLNPIYLIFLINLIFWVF